MSAGLCRLRTIITSCLLRACKSVIYYMEHPQLLMGGSSCYSHSRVVIGGNNSLTSERLGHWKTLSPVLLHPIR